MSLTNLDQPLFDGAEATKRDLVDYLDAVRDRIIPVLRDRPLSVIRVLRGQAPFMQKNVPKYTPPWVRDGAAVGGDLEARGVLRAVQRPPDAAVVRQPARGGVPPDADRAPIAGTAPPTWCSTSTRRRATRSRWRSAAAQLVRAGAGRGRAGGRGQDQRREGRARVRADRRRRRPSRTWPRPPGRIAARAERLDPALATTAFIREDRGGKVFLDSTRAGGATVVGGLQPAGAAGRAGVVPGGLGRARPRRARPTSPCTRRPRLLADGDPWADLMPDAAAAEPRR